MKTLKYIALLIGLTLNVLAQPTTITSTTLAAAVTSTSATTVQLASATGVQANGFIFVDNELMSVTGSYVSGSTVVNVRRGAGSGIGGKSALHVSGSFVYVASSVGTSASAFQVYDRSGACTASNQAYTPWINVENGRRFQCTDGQWGLLGEFFVPGSNCSFAPTTSTVTVTFPQIGASTIPVVNGVTNAAAGTTTLVCNILVPTEVSAGRGAIITDIVVAIGSQVTAPTSLGTSTLGYIQFPTPVATTQTASTVTPVAIGGTVTTLGPTTTVLTVTTAGAFLTFSHNYATVVEINTDLRLLQYTFPFLQSAAAAMTLNSPGLFVHYQKRMI